MEAQLLNVLILSKSSLQNRQFLNRKQAAKVRSGLQSLTKVLFQPVIRSGFYKDRQIRTLPVQISDTILCTVYLHVALKEVSFFPCQKHVDNAHWIKYWRIRLKLPPQSLVNVLRNKSRILIGYDIFCRLIRISWTGFVFLRSRGESMGSGQGKFWMWIHVQLNTMNEINDFVFKGFFKSVFGAEFRPHSQCKNDQYFPKKWLKIPNLKLLSESELICSNTCSRLVSLCIDKFCSVL